MHVRQARDSDATAIARLSCELAGHVADPDPGLDISELMELGFGDSTWFDCLVAEVDSELVGFALYCKRFEAHTRSRKLWLGDLVVAKRHRRQGVGAMLVKALRARALDLKCDGIVLELWVQNATARDFYKKAGAELDAELEIHLIPISAG
ncbi:MAG: GNAT family N-acetyltransferase [Alphaproteobacteria bacterium]